MLIPDKRYRKPLLPVRVNGTGRSCPKLLPNRSWATRSSHRLEHVRVIVHKCNEHYTSPAGPVGLDRPVSPGVHCRSLEQSVSWLINQSRVKHSCSSFIVLLALVLTFGVLLNYLLFLCSIRNTALTTSMIGVTKSTLTSFIGLFCFDTFHPTHMFLWVILRVR